MAIQYFLTDVGRDVALNATSLGLNVSLSHIAVGTAKYDPLTALDRTALVAEVERYPLNGGGVEPNSHTLRFVTSIEPTITVDGFEIGIFTDTGALFAIASTTGNDPLIRLVANIVAISSFGMILSTINLTNLIITVDPNTPICVALMNQHLDHPDPHTQYLLKTDFNAGVIALQYADNVLQQNINTEEANRISADNLLNNKIDYEINQRANADNTLLDNLNSEQSSRIYSDNLINDKIDYEIVNRINALNDIENRKFNKSGGTVAGDVTINGILTVLANIAALTLKSNVGGTEIETLFGKLTLTNIPNGGGISQVFNTTADRYQFDKPIYAPNLDMLGVGQSWYDMTSQRAFSEIYTNDTSKPIQVSCAVHGYELEGLGEYVAAKVDSVLVQKNYGHSTGSNYYGTYNFSFIVPVGSTYQIFGNDRNILYWSELR
ncbi:phage tail protein [Acinetobacter junii]|uniref:phage tail-collar fiber domain-containing protein n=1 Tax=Acinetobacter junii TaxID=40215 RepID=UPI002447ADAD|nr:phage tail protein [Acinetobacter junii]MDH0718242.1 phage tail protein [Acinetobacter junii]